MGWSGHKSLIFTLQPTFFIKFSLSSSCYAIATIHHRTARGMSRNCLSRHPAVPPAHTIHYREMILISNLSTLGSIAFLLPQVRLLQHRHHNIFLFHSQYTITYFIDVISFSIYIYMIIIRIIPHIYLLSQLSQTVFFPSFVTWDSWLAWLTSRNLRLTWDKRQ